MIEAFAAVMTMQFALDMGFTKVLVEGYALEVVKQLNTKTQNLSTNRNVIEEDRGIRSFQTRQVKYTKTYQIIFII